MHATTLPRPLAADLHTALEAAGHHEHAAEIVGLLPPAGQHALLEALHADRLPLLLARWVEDLADILRCTTADAAQLRDLLGEQELTALLEAAQR